MDTVASAWCKKFKFRDQSISSQMTIPDQLKLDQIIGYCGLCMEEKTCHFLGTRPNLCNRYLTSVGSMPKNYTNLETRPDQLKLDQTI